VYEDMAVRVERSLERRQEVVDAAVRIADREGIDAVSMRNLADELGMGTMTLYSYVSDKDELLDLMREQVSREMLVPEPLPDDWREALRAIASRTRGALDRHAWVLKTIAHRPRGQLNTMRHIEQSLRAVASLDVDDDTKGAILMAVDDYTIGHAIRARVRRARAGRRLSPSATDLGPEVEAALAGGELPLLAAAIAARGREAFPMPPEADFERGLGWLLDGIETSVTGRVTLRT
jgi:AcrR family transcriptional regulator